MSDQEAPADKPAEETQAAADGEQPGAAAADGEA